MPAQPCPAVLLVGAPGVGKGTQGKRLGALPRLIHISSGDMFRALPPDSPTGKESRRYFENGELVPDELTIRIWREHVQRLIDTDILKPDRDTLILDGIPRNVHQCQMLDGDIKVLRVIHLVASNEDAMVERMRKRAQIEGRKDDADEGVIRHRLEVYRQQSWPIVTYYSTDLLVEVDALGTPDEVSEEISRVIFSTRPN